MTSKKITPSTGKQQLANFLAQIDQLPQRANSQPSQPGRLMFAMDATASRQPSWDRACQLQAEMFVAAAATGGLQLQLCYYRGFHEFHYSPWLNNSAALLRIMSAVQCLGGYTQIHRVLDHALHEQRQTPINAVVFIGDALEENTDKLCHKAGQLGLLDVPLFMFQEGTDHSVRQCFQQMAHLSKGAYAAFNEHSAQELAQLLKAVAIYASGGRNALDKLTSAAARQLIEQLP